MAGLVPAISLRDTPCNRAMLSGVTGTSPVTTGMSYVRFFGFLLFFCCM